MLDCRYCEFSAEKSECYHMGLPIASWQTHTPENLTRPVPLESWSASRQRHRHPTQAYNNTYIHAIRTVCIATLASH